MGVVVVLSSSSSWLVVVVVDVGAGDLMLIVTSVDAVAGCCVHTATIMKQPNRLPKRLLSRGLISDYDYRCLKSDYLH
jgi:hypothetical protein